MINVWKVSLLATYTSPDINTNIKQGIATYGLMASWRRGFKEFADDIKKMLREYRFLANLEYEFVVLIGD